MQYVDGQSLADLLKSCGQLPLEETLSIVEQCLAGLKATHDRGLVHRDVKPGNILLERGSNRALLADFGLVKGVENRSTLTATGTIMGTVDYIAPEQARGTTIDARTDLYSLGVLMYEMLSGRLPFEASSSTALIFKHAYEQPPLLSEVAPDIPQRIVAIVTRLMAKNPDHRYQSTTEVLADLAAFRAGKAPAIPRRAVDVGSSIFQRGDELLKLSGENPNNAELEVVRHEFNIASITPKHLWAGWHDRLWSNFRRKLPQLAEQLANTTQQVEGAVIEYERRHRELVQLVRDSEEVCGELKAQVASHEEAAREAGAAAAKVEPEMAVRLQQDQNNYEKIAADFAAQLKQHLAQTNDLQVRLIKVAATLQQLRNNEICWKMRLRACPSPH